MKETVKEIDLSKLHPHPKNPRFAPREDVVDEIATQIVAAGAFDQAHALIVRPNAKGYEIISGHHRALAAKKAKLKAVPCWVREMSDEEAYMALVLHNAQSELHPLEEGLHALGSGMTVRDYAKRIGKERAALENRWTAAKVMKACPDIRTRGISFLPFWYALSEVHAAPDWLWPVLAARVIDKKLTVEQARTLVAPLKGLSDVVKQTKANLSKGTEDADRLIASLIETLQQKRPASRSDVLAICEAIEREQRALIDERWQSDLLRTRREEEIRAKLERLRRSVSLDEWKTLADDERAALLATSADDVTPGRFTEQENDAIEWAQWSWNPVTGCLHDCPYCYARDIAQSIRMAQAYPNGFEPTFRSAMLMAPRSMKVPPEAKSDERFKNVFTGSMADLFGRWVPAEWINAVLSEMRNAPQWNFLCLTKFPKRMAEFDIPDNAWMGTTVDLQARVPNAEAAFAKVKCRVRWLSIEPMLEPLKFSHLDRFDWIVIGGASRSTKTPEWKPPFGWIEDLVAQARRAQCRVYFKTNLLGKRELQLPFDAPIAAENAPPSKEFNYLGKTKHSTIE